MTKGDLLKYLNGKLKKFTIPKLIHFDISEWERNNLKIFKKILEINSEALIIRSSAIDEDLNNNSAAGQYESILNVSNNFDEIKKSVQKVINSYKNKKNYSRSNQIIVQAQIKDVSISGVLFTYEMNTGAPYYVINYDDKSGETNSVTSGIGEYSNRTLYIHREYKEEQLKSKRFKALLDAVKELEEVLESSYLDIEFALDNNFDTYLFQARKITTSVKWNNKTLSKINVEINKIENFSKKFFVPENLIYGDYSILAQMPDWNPVEMIGRSPKKLDYSLYKILITDSSWRKARKLMGYFHPTDKQLMVSLGGQPYIDTRLSFNSFLPSKLNKNISEKLVNSWLDKLKNNPQLHDKIEFYVAITCFSFDIEKKIENLTNLSLNQTEKKKVIKAYKELTLNLINSNDKASISNCLNQINYLDSLHSERYSKIDNLTIGQLSGLIENTIQYGVIPFAILARHAFVAKTLFESLSQYDFFDLSFIDSFYRSISTVATDFHEDSIRLSRSEITDQHFINKYGHLRPGTYDITSLRYDQMDSTLFKLNSFEKSFKQKKKKISNEEITQLNEILKENKFVDVNAEKFLNYIEKSIKGREYAKFVFTKNISSILEVIAKFGNENNFSREEISNIDINEIISFDEKNKGLKLKQNMNKIIQDRQRNIELANAIRLPQMLYDTNGIYVIPFQVSQPNFISKKVVEAEVFVLNNISEVSLIKNKIVMIENADPGYDFIFNYSIKGLVTKFGGSNSHMAIRCAEFDIPAAIGCGEQIFESINSNGTIVRLNCLTSKLTKVI